MLAPKVASARPVGESTSPVHGAAGKVICNAVFCVKLRGGAAAGAARQAPPRPEAQWRDWLLRSPVAAEAP